MHKRGFRKILRAFCLTLYFEQSEEATEKPTTDEPTTEDPTTEEPTTDEPTTEDPTTEEPTTDEPTSEDPTTAGGEELLFSWIFVSFFFHFLWHLSSYHICDE